MAMESGMKQHFYILLSQMKKVVFKPEVADAPATVKAMVRAHVRHIKKNTDNTFGPVALDKDTMPVNAQPTDFSKVALPPYLTEGPPGKMIR
jgi:hypothetical protein